MNWGILATGTIAAKFAKTVRAMEAEGERLVAVASRSGVRAAAFAAEHGVSAAYESYERLLRDDEVDAVYIATPNHAHYQNALQCLQAGKHVLCEKPFTTNAEQARELYALAEEKGLFIMEAFWIAFLPLHARLKQIIQSNRLGALRHVRCEYGFIAKGTRRERKFKSELGGGALLDIGIYNLGFLRMLTGCNPQSFTTQSHFNEYGTDDFSVLQLTYPNGVTAHSMQSIGLQTERQAALFFEGGVVYLPDFQGAYRMTVQPVEGEAYAVECPADINGFEYQIREVTACVRAGKTRSDIFRPQDSVDTLALMDEVRAAWNMKFTFEE